MIWRRLILIVAFWFVLLAPFSAFGASLVWDASTGTVDGYIIYYTDGTNQYNYNNGQSLSCDLSNLNLAPGVEYTFTVRAYNAAGESGDSNSITYTREPFVPPANVLPVSVDTPTDPGNLTQL